MIIYIKITQKWVGRHPNIPFDAIHAIFEQYKLIKIFDEIHKKLKFFEVFALLREKSKNLQKSQFFISVHFFSTNNDIYQNLPKMGLHTSKHLI